MRETLYQNVIQLQGSTSNDYQEGFYFLIFFEFGLNMAHIFDGLAACYNK